MKQLILPLDYKGEEIYTLPYDDSHYLLRVQRKQLGTELKLLAGNGKEYLGKIISTDNDLCTLSLKEVEKSINSEQPGIILIQAIPKGKKIDLMIRQSVEIGVKRFIPVIGDHSVPQFKTEVDKEKKRERWLKIVKEASQQSGTKTLTKLDNIHSMEEALNVLPSGFTGIFFHQDPLNNRSIHHILNNNRGDIVLVVGPEGGLSDREIQLLQKANFTPVLLGKNILRAETATTFGLGAVSMIIYEQNQWDIAD